MASKPNLHELLVSILEVHFILNRNPAVEAKISVPQSKDSYIKETHIKSFLLYERSMNQKGRIHEYGASSSQPGQ